MRSTPLLFVSLVAAASLSSVAGASMIQIASNQPSSTDMLGRFTGSITYTANTLTTGTLTIVLNNTNTAAEGGFITGVVFNVPGVDTVATSALVTANPVGFTNLGPTASASPFGTYEAGAALGGSWLGGGSPNGGVAVGQTGTFTFAITATDAASLTAGSFLTSGSAPAPLVRFKGFTNGGSDKVPSILVPAPASIACVGMGGLLAARRRRR